MRETQFIRQNKKKWQDFEEVLEGQSRDPDTLSDLFIHVTDDLSYARTFYPNRSVRAYLNGLAQGVFLQVNRHRPAPWKQLWRFWTDELPDVLHQNRYALRLSLAVFVLSLGIGLLSSAYDPEFVQVILGDAYVNMTRENIASGDPMAVYKQRGAFGMFLGITLNNLMVSAFTFAMGIFWGLGSLIILVRNAVMVGAFQYFFIEHGLFRESFLTIWIHGALEISAIVIAGAAGMTLGKGLAFPGAYSRLQAFQHSARQGIKILVGVAPLFLVAGFLEGYFTRHTDTPDAVRAVFIASCFLFVALYYGWYPWFRARMAGGTAPVGVERVAHLRDTPIAWQRIKGSGELLGDAFVILGRHPGRYLAYAAGGALVFVGVLFAFSGQAPSYMYQFRGGGLGASLRNISHLLAWRQGALPPALVAWPMATVLAAVTFRQLDHWRGGRSTLARRWWALAIPCLMLVGCLAWEHPMALLLVLVAQPVLLLWAYAVYAEGGRVVGALGVALNLLKNQFMATLGLHAMVLLLGWFVMTLAHSTVTSLFFNLVNWLVTASQATLDEWSVMLMAFILATFLNACWLVLFTVFGLHYFSLREISEATGLRAEITQVGAGRKLRGFAQE